MVCVYCGSSTAVKNSRLQRHSNYIWRRRTCAACGNIFTTIERPELSGTFMVRSSTNNRNLEPLNRDRLFVSIYESCKHRPDAVSEASSLTQTIINKLVAKRPDGIVNRTDVAEQAHAVLKRFDHTAATVYAAYHLPGTANNS